jgi:membrane protein DedA with SNARE-associated domain
MSPDALIALYGYPAILVGTFLEGETILVLGGFAAHRGYMALGGVILCAFAGSLAGDSLFFYLGRRHSSFMLRKRPNWKDRIDRARLMFGHFETPMILSFRFLYGLRTIAPFAIGMSSVRASKFVLLNAIGALVWASVFGTGGYLFGNALEAVLGDVKRYEPAILGGIAATGVLIWIINFFRHR